MDPAARRTACACPGLERRQHSFSQPRIRFCRYCLLCSTVDSLTGPAGTGQSANEFATPDRNAASRSVRRPPQCGGTWRSPSCTISCPEARHEDGPLNIYGGHFPSGGVGRSARHSRSCRRILAPTGGSGTLSSGRRKRGISGIRARNRLTGRFRSFRILSQDLILRRSYYHIFL